MEQNPYTPPTFVDQLQTADRPSRGITWVLFSFSGRIPRKTFWLWNLALYGLLFLGASLYGSLIESSAIGAEDTETDTDHFSTIIFLILMIPVISIGLALRIKRWHDRDKAGWWVFISAIPYIGGLWTFIECGCIRGTYGPNRFGEDPT